MDQLVSTYYNAIQPQIIHGMNERIQRYTNIVTKLQDFALNRHSSFWTQFVQIFIRNGRYLFRNKKALAGVLFNSLIISLLILSVFWHIGEFPPEVQYAFDHPSKETIDEANVKY